MRNIKHSYAREKLGLAIEVMATDEGDVRQRLLHAYMLFHPVKANHFPQKLQNKWNSIYQQLTKLGPKYDCNGKHIIGSVENTLKK